MSTLESNVGVATPPGQTAYSAYPGNQSPGQSGNITGNQSLAQGANVSSVPARRSSVTSPVNRMEQSSRQTLNRQGSARQELNRQGSARQELSRQESTRQDVLRQRLNPYTLSHEQLLKEFNDLFKENEENKAWLGKQKKQYDQLNDSYQKLKKQEETRCDHHQRTLSELKRQMEQWVHDQSSLPLEIEQVKKENAEIQQESEWIRQENETLRQDNDGFGQQRLQLLSDIAKLRADSEDTTRELESAAKQRADDMHEIEKL